MNILKQILSMLSIVASLLLLLMVAFIFYLAIPIKTTKIVVLPQGSITKVINSLNSQGYSLNDIDKYLLVYLGQPKSGTLIIGGKKMDRIDFLRKLTNAKEAIDVITLIPGETLPIFLQELSKEFNLNEAKLQTAYNKFSDYKEAGILPETYHIAKNSEESTLIKTLIEQSKDEYKKLAKEHSKQYDPKEWNRILTIASIIQKEAANKEEMPLVASVIFNRLTLNMPLQMDGTLNYGKYSHVKVTPTRIRTDTSGFNTYANKGLPPYPVCSVSLDAIRSALHPEKTKYLYFMKNKKGVHDFSRSYKEHLRNIANAK